MSKPANHSPSPWTLHEYEDDGVHLADVFDRNLECKTACLNIADARLIAAAPDLLEALAYLLGDVKAFNDLEEEDSARLYAGSVFRAEQAISKAKGGDND